MLKVFFLSSAGYTIADHLCVANLLTKTDHYGGIADDILLISGALFAKK